jgi:hypothetical protein
LEIPPISDLRPKIKEKEKKREVITQRIYARAFGMHNHEIRSQCDASNHSTLSK